MGLINQIRIVLGEDICEHCGSRNILKDGFEYWNYRFRCLDCEKETGVMQT